MQTSGYVDHSDWLKTAAIAMVVVGHIGYFFIDDAGWWSVFGRMAAPAFFFLMGYARSRTIPIKWLWLGLALTLLDSWNTDWAWVAPNILFSMVLIRLARPYVLIFLQLFGWAGFALFTVVLLTVLPIAGEVVEYGSEGWLWALFGLCQRMYVDGVARGPGSPSVAMTEKFGRMRLLACAVAVVIYVWQEQIEFEFTQPQLIAVVAGVSALTLGLLAFVRGPSRLQPPAPVAGALRFLGHHTLVIYVVQLAGSELIINWFPKLAA